MVFYPKLDPRRNMVVGVGSALIDILAHESDDFVAAAGGVKGGMVYVEKNVIDHTVGRATLTPAVVPGGSACNTMVGIGRLGGRARFVGKCGNGPMGQLFRTDLKKQNVEPLLFESDSPTGRVLSLITPDAQRSMLTFLGASAEARPEEITSACFDQAAIVHIEGYLLFNQALMLGVLKAARQAGARICLDLASFNVVEQARVFLHDLVAEYVDILIANEDEALAYTGEKDEHKALAALRQGVDLAVLKLGPRGSLVGCDATVVPVAPFGEGQALDTTGAGDLWASGFLYGLVGNRPLAQCGALGSRCGYEVCQVMGAHIPDDRWQVIRNDMEVQWP